jgi:hypothetical protein
MANSHKFQRKIEITYEELMKANFENVVRLVRLMEKEIGVEKAHYILLRARVEGDLEGVKAQMNDLKPFSVFNDFKQFMKDLHENEFTCNLFTINYPIDDEKEVEFRTTECIMAKVFKDLNASDIGYIMCCQPDYESTPAYSPNVYLKRTKSLMKGDDYCDTKYCWKK